MASPNNIIEHSNLSDKVYNILLDRIITRKIKPGEKLIEEELAESLGISRTPIREALNRLFRDELMNLDCFVAYAPRNDTFSARHCEPKAWQSQTLKFLSINLAPCGRTFDTDEH